MFQERPTKHQKPFIEYEQQKSRQSKTETTNHFQEMLPKYQQRARELRIPELFEEMKAQVIPSGIITEQKNPFDAFPYRIQLLVAWPYLLTEVPKKQLFGADILRRGNYYPSSIYQKKFEVSCEFQPLTIKKRFNSNNGAQILLSTSTMCVPNTWKCISKVKTESDNSTYEPLIINLDKPAKKENKELMEKFFIDMLDFIQTRHKLPLTTQIEDDKNKIIKAIKMGIIDINEKEIQADLSEYAPSILQEI